MDTSGIEVGAISTETGMEGAVSTTDTADTFIEGGVFTGGGGDVTSGVRLNCVIAVKNRLKKASGPARRRRLHFLQLISLAEEYMMHALIPLARQTRRDCN